jgi:response regulator RpfG family c-di-GMP phosphodiesterase
METKTDSPKSISILFVEDDEVILELQSSILAMKFPDVMLYTANNGRLGLELFKAHTPDIVLTDINMSEMCGVQMAENIRAIKPATKIIAITGKSADTSIIGKFIKHNSDGEMVEVDHLIIKPVDISELCGVVEQYIDEIE